MAWGKIMNCALRHFGIVVRDLEKGLSFYAGILGLSPFPIVQEAGDFIETVLARPGTCVSTVKLRGNTGDTLLELLHFSATQTSLPHAAMTPVDRPGPTHVAFTVGDIEALFQKLTDAGCVCLSRPLLSEDGKVLVLFCRDFEGNLVELVQPLPAQPDC